jgi:hypothetical protein
MTATCFGFSYRAISRLRPKEVYIQLTMYHIVRDLVYMVTNIQDGREITEHPDNTHIRINLSLHNTAQHAVQCKMAIWQQCQR